MLNLDAAEQWENSMQIQDDLCLVDTLDTINETFFFNRPLSQRQRKEISHQIARLQGRSPHPSSFTGFALKDHEQRHGIRLFTGEKLRTQHPAVDILGVEACRALLLLGVDSDEIRIALSRAEKGLADACFVGECILGECAHANVSVWRYLAVGGLDDAANRISRYMDALSAHRDDKGRWRRFPFYYTLLALSELDHPAAQREIRYVAPTCERKLGRYQRKDVISTRRRIIMKRILDKANPFRQIQLL